MFGSYIVHMLKNKFWLCVWQCKCKCKCSAISQLCRSPHSCISLNTWFLPCSVIAGNQTEIYFYIYEAISKQHGISKSKIDSFVFDGCTDPLQRPGDICHRCDSMIKLYRYHTETTRSEIFTTWLHHPEGYSIKASRRRTLSLLLFLWGEYSS